jgi:hypothetical protein
MLQRSTKIRVANIITPLVVKKIPKTQGTKEALMPRQEGLL